MPKLMKLLFYSEILDQHYAVCVTRRTVAKIEEATTFDHYILKVNIQEKLIFIGIVIFRLPFKTLVQSLVLIFVDKCYIN